MDQWYNLWVSKDRRDDTFGGRRILGGHVGVGKLVAWVSVNEHWRGFFF